MKLKQLLLSALAMVAVATGYAQVDLDEVIEVDGEIETYWYNDIGQWSSGDNYLIVYEDAIGTISFNCEKDFEVSFDYNVGLDSYLNVRFDDDPILWVSYGDFERSGSFTKEFTAGDHYISFEFSLPEYYEGTGTYAEITNFKAIVLPCKHLFPDVSDIPATCTEPSMSVCQLCDELLPDGKSEALGHDFDDNGKCQREGCDYFEPRYPLFKADGISVSIFDQDKPWEVFKTADNKKGLRSSSNPDDYGKASFTGICLNSEFDYTLSFDYDIVDSPDGCVFVVYLDSDGEVLSVYKPKSDTFSLPISKGSHVIRLLYVGDRSVEDDRVQLTNIKVRSELDATDDGLIEVEDIVMGINQLGSGNLTEEQLNEIIHFILHKE